MTRKLEETLNLPPLDDLLKADGVLPSSSFVDEPEQESEVQETSQSQNDLVNSLERAEKSLAMIDGRDHGEAMDQIFKETLDHARNIADLGYNVDHARAARMFEVASNFYKAAMDAKNSKRDAQLKAMQLALNQQKLELEKKAAGNDPATIDVGAVIVEDRNELIKRFREQAKLEQEGRSKE